MGVANENPRGLLSVDFIMKITKHLILTNSKVILRHIYAEFFPVMLFAVQEFLKNN